MHGFLLQWRATWTLMEFCTVSRMEEEKDGKEDRGCTNRFLAQVNTFNMNIKGSKDFNADTKSPGKCIQINASHYISLENKWSSTSFS